MSLRRASSLLRLRAAVATERHHLAATMACRRRSFTQPRETHLEPVRLCRPGLAPPAARIRAGFAKSPFPTSPPRASLAPAPVRPAGIIAATPG
ncbi:hypothetical protein ZWY2020_014042 [Hordeum vulgare]|nr:hypothetical protein ZWY2020_014042 [Hordeum vulgare]